MFYTEIYNSPLGEMLLASDDTAIVGAWFKGERYFARGLGESRPVETEPLRQLKIWLDTYFAGKCPDFQPPVHFIGTPFQIEVWNILCKIPYGATVTYSEIAAEVARRTGVSRMSAQAVGTAVGKNNVNILVPCHRVVGKNNSLAGYAGGIDKKIYLLKLEGAYKDAYFIPKHICAP